MTVKCIREELSLNASVLYLGQAKQRIMAGLSRGEMNVIWAAGLFTTFSRDMRATVGGGEAPLSWFANCCRRRAWQVNRSWKL